MKFNLCPVYVPRCFLLLSLFSGSSKVEISANFLTDINFIIIFFSNINNVRFISPFNNNK